MTKSIILEQSLTLLELRQALCCDHLIGASSNEEPFNHGQSELPLVQLHFIPLCPIAVNVIAEM